MRIRNRKSLFLCSTILRGRRLKDDNEPGGGAGDDGTEVGAGFAAAAEKMASDDTRTPEQKAAAQTTASAEEAGDNVDGDEGGEGEEGDEQQPKKKRDTAEYIRELKRERREDRAARATLEARLAAIENSGLPQKNSGVNSPDTSEKPDANDATKYPLGVLDDGYIEDLIEWKSDQKVRQALDGRAQTESEQAEAQRQTEHLTTLRSKVDDLSAKGSTVYDDYEEKVLEAGLRGDYQLTETTFTAAAEAEHGVDILYALANDKAEAKRVAELTPYQQLKYVAEKDGEYAKAKPRKKPQADATPPANLPRGRNASSPIRGDTEDLNDFRKLYYQK